MSDRVTYAALHDLLTRLDFSWKETEVRRAIPAREAKTCFAYRHAPSGTVLWLPSKEDRPALEGDVLSLRTHLTYRGLVDEAEFDAFLAGRKPADKSA